MELKKIYNRIIPLKGYRALTICPFVFIREGEQFPSYAERHEETHALQQIECLIVGALLAVGLYLLGCGWWSLIPLGLFFELYLIEWAVKIPFCKFDINRAYLSISTEREAYEHQYNILYNGMRGHFAWTKYLFTLKQKSDE